MAEGFYTRLQTGPQTFDVAACAPALHHAVRALRDRRHPLTGADLSDRPSFWAPFLHAGA